MDTHQPLVPLADRPLAGPEYEDSESQTVWHNPTDRQVVLDLNVDTPRPGRKPRNWEERNGKVRYVLKAGETKAIPSKFDMGIQHTQCHHIDCLQRPFYCRSNEEGHEKSTVGGYGPQLVNRGTQKAPIRPGFITLAPALDDVLARQQAAEQEEFRNWQLQRMAESRAASAKLEQERAAADKVARSAHADSGQSQQHPNNKNK
jgi:hypothetical protein